MITCRCKFDSETDSLSTMPSVPTPAAARYISSRRAEPAGADHQHARSFERVLAGAADLAQHDVAGIAFKFVGAQHRPAVPYLDPAQLSKPEPDGRCYRPSRCASIAPFQRSEAVMRATIAAALMIVATAIYAEAQPAGQGRVKPKPAAAVHPARANPGRYRQGDGAGGAPGDLSPIWHGPATITASSTARSATA